MSSQGVLELPAGIWSNPYHAANSKISRTCEGPVMGRGLRGTHGVSMACSAMRSKLSGPTLVARRLRRHAKAGNKFS